MRERDGEGGGKVSRGKKESREKGTKRGGKERKGKKERGRTSTGPCGRHQTAHYCSSPGGVRQLHSRIIGQPSSPLPSRPLPHPRQPEEKRRTRPSRHRSLVPSLVDQRHTPPRKLDHLAAVLGVCVKVVEGCTLGWGGGGLHRQRKVSVERRRRGAG